MPAPAAVTGRSLSPPLRALTALALAALLFAPAPSPAQQAGERDRRVTIDDALALRGVGDVAVSPDGRRVAYVVTEREVDPEEDVHRTDSNLWVADVETGETVQLTHDPADDGSPRWAPDGSWIAFLSDRTDTTQVHGIRPDGGGPWRVTGSPTPVESFRLAPGADRVAFTASPTQSEASRELEARRGRPMVADSAYADQYTLLWVAPLEAGRADTLSAPGPADGQARPPVRAGERARSSPDTLHVQGFAWGPAGRSLAWSARPRPELRTYRHAAVFVQDSAGAPPRVVSDMPGGEGVAAWEESPGLLITGSGHAVGSHNDEVWLADPAGARDPVSLTEELDHDADLVAASSDRLLVESPIRTGRGAYAIPLEDRGPAGEPRRVDDGELFYGDFSASDDGSRLGFVAQGPRTPPDVNVSPAADFEPRRLTEVNPQASAFALGEQRVVTWESSAGGETIEGVLTLPVGYERGDRVPLLVDVHGGPSGVDGMDYKAGGYAYPTQVFAGLGYAVLQPNYRGSTGYGERFRQLIRGRISGDEWRDVNSGVDHLVEEGLADPDRLGLMGWSYGGHQTYWGITRTDRFSAASAGAGATDLISMYSQTDIPGFYHTYLGPRPWEDFELYEERSSYRYVERVTTPLLIQVGEEDDRVPAEQSIQFYEAVKSIGNVPAVKLVQYPGQSHGVDEPRLRRDLMTRNVKWFARWIPTSRSREAGFGAEDGR